jgi:uncharacterized Ntn-hydrolase superfamily protein
MKRLETRGTTGTFSILAISADSKLMGVAVASGSTKVGDRVPHAKPGVGVVATQAFTKVDYGIEGLDLLSSGLFPREALDRLLMKDPGRELRQVAVMDFKRRRAIFTGAKVPYWCGEAAGEDYIVIGNLLSGKDVVPCIAEEFERMSGGLALRMVKALEAGRKSGGDRRGERSAALVVVCLEKVEVQIKVHDHACPIEELARKLRAYRR